MNAIIWAARKGISIEGATIYVTLEPCSQCSKNLIASGIKRIVYEKSYEYTNSDIVSKFLKDNSVIIEQLKIDK
jgi:dCMP deaminase